MGRSLESRSRRSGHSSSLFSLASWRNRVFRHCLFLAKTKSLFFPQTPIDLVGEKGPLPPTLSFFLPSLSFCLFWSLFCGVCVVGSTWKTGLHVAQTGSKLDITEDDLALTSDGFCCHLPNAGNEVCATTPLTAKPSPCLGAFLTPSTTSSLTAPSGP